MNTGNSIKFFRKRAKISQLDLEIAAGISQGVISRVKNSLNNHLAKEIWKRLNNSTFTSFEQRAINLDLFEDKFKLHYAMEPLTKK